MIVLRNYILAGLMATFFLASSSVNATVYIPSFGNSGLQTFSYTFTNDYAGTVTIGVSDEGDYVVSSYLELPEYAVTLDTDAVVDIADTSAYINTLGEPGTDGQLYTFDLIAAAGDVLSFDWVFSTIDYHPFHDFAFIDIEGLHYEVLAEIDNTPVPVPAAVWLFGSGLLGLFGMRKRSQVISQPA